MDTATAGAKVTNTRSQRFMFAPYTCNEVELKNLCLTRGLARVAMDGPVHPFEKWGDSAPVSIVTSRGGGVV
jgi:hypothetical protein